MPVESFRRRLLYPLCFDCSLLDPVSFQFFQRPAPRSPFYVCYKSDSNGPTLPSPPQPLADCSLGLCPFCRRIPSSFFGKNSLSVPCFFPRAFLFRFTFVGNKNLPPTFCGKTSNLECFAFFSIRHVGVIVAPIVFLSTLAGAPRPSVCSHSMSPACHH